MLNDLFTRQNDSLVLKCQVAKQRLYSKAKFWAYLPLEFIVLGLAIVAVEKLSGHESLSWLVVLVSLAGWCASVMGEYRVDACKRQAAAIQQFVDRYIFRNAFTDEQLAKWVAVPLQSVLAEATAGITEEDIVREKVRNWYSNYSTLPPQLAVLECQKSNLRWDFGLRLILLSAFVLILITLLIWGIFKTWDVPVKHALPALTWGAGVISFFARASIQLVHDLIHIQEISSYTGDIEKHRQNNNDIAEWLVVLQNKIYEHRSKRFLVPDWLYKLCRSKMQTTADAIATARGSLEDKQC